MTLPSHPCHDADLTADLYPWACHSLEECDWCGRTSCHCADDPDGDFEALMDGDDDSEFLRALHAREDAETIAAAVREGRVPF